MTQQPRALSARTLLPLLFLPLFPLPAAVHARGFESIILNEFEYCIRYYGSVSASITVPEGFRDRDSYNGSFSCPSTWDFPWMQGAILTLCPPDHSGPSYAPGAGGKLAIEARLEFDTLGGVLNKPIDNFELANFLVTNGSVAGPWDEGGEPAVLAKHTWSKMSVIGDEQWTINGTEKSLVSEPDLDNAKKGLYLDCSNLTPLQRRGRYCGESGDIDDGGCWRAQHFVFNMHDKMNFSIGFARHQAMATVSVSQGWKYRNGTSMGAGEALVKFGGLRELPSVVDYDFWENSEINYEHEKETFDARYANMEFVEDDAGMPVFVNNTATGEWFATRNATFSAWVNDASGSLRSTGSYFVPVFVAWLLASS